TAPNCPIDLEAGQVQAFAGVAADAEDGPLTGEWRDLLTNASQDGDTWNYSSNDVGKHVLRYSPTDSTAATGTDTCAVRVLPAGGSVASLFPSTAPVQAAMPNHNLAVVVIDGSGNLIVGSHGQLGIFDSALALINDGAGTTDPYDGGELSLGGGAA